MLDAGGGGGDGGGGGGITGVVSGGIYKLLDELVTWFCSPTFWLAGLVGLFSKAWGGVPIPDEPVGPVGVVAPDKGAPPGSP